MAPEFTLTWHSPEPWRPADCLAFGKLMALFLAGNWRRELLRARLAARLTPKQLAALWPDGGGDLVTLSELYRGLPLDGLAALIPNELRVADASNEWVVAGSRTRSGKPLLANDPHLRFAAPILWYLARLKAPGLSLAGATVPGAPFHVLGHNGRIAWGFTNTHSDTQDLFVERLADGDPGRYLTPEGSAPFRLRSETILVRGGDPVVLEVRATRHGPVISDVVPRAADQAEAGSVIALAFPGLGADDLTPQAIYRLNRADGWAAFVAALRDFQAPQQNVVYADVDGNIGFYAPARVPVRRNGTGLAPVPGWTGEYDWTGWVPRAGLPKALNPPEGVIVNANNRIVGPAYPHFLAAHWEADFRARRIAERIEAARTLGIELTVEDFLALQRDTVSLAARHVLPPMLAGVEPNPRIRDSLDRLAGWDGAMDRRRAEPLIFTAWLRELNRALYADELGPAFDDYWRLRPEVVANMLTADPAWCDVVTTPGTETCAERLTRALERALDWIERRYGADPTRWRWGAAHRARFRHRVLESVPLVRRLANLEIESAGGDHTVNRGTGDVSDPDRPFAHIHGAGFRAVYDLGNLDRSRFVIATGQSGNPLSPHYRDFLERWRDGGTVRLPAVPEGKLRRLVLAPRD